MRKLFLSRQDTKAGDCQICLDRYNESKRPRVLPCGHVFCSACLVGVMITGSVTCPCCRTAHRASGIEDFPIVFAVEELLRETDARGEVLLPRRRGSRLLEELREGQALAIQDSASQCADLLAQMVEYKGTVLRWMTEHEALMKRVHDVLLHHKAVRQMLEEEKNLVDEFYSEGRRKQLQLIAAGEALHASGTPQETATSIHHADELQDEAETWLRKCVRQFPEANTVRKSIKVSGASSLSVEDSCAAITS